MGKIKYIFKVIFGGSFKRFAEVINRVHEKCGQNKVYTFFDMIWCFLKYGAGVHDYLIFGFYNMNGRQRNTYMTRVRNKRLIEMVNDESYAHIFDNKDEFNKKFTEFLGREFLCVREMSKEEFEEFIKDKEIIFAKPSSSESGKGIERLVKSDFESVDAMYDYIVNPEKNFGVIEQEIKQHHDLNTLYPHAINSYRIVTIVTEGKAHCVYATAKAGSDGKFVDNMENSGIACPIDYKTGKIAGCAHTSALINYDQHPYTGVTLVGFQLPYVKEAVALCKKAALVVPEIAYVGWDCAVTEDGPVIIEGNNYPGYDFWQLPEHTPEKRGLYPYFKKRVKGFK
ncbi:MAG: carboxylate--amine ligase [Lachnospiraceae bacterium]|nr:carboxylate--amine ligase [Lachnospiraceae bacterium]